MSDQTEQEAIEQQKDAQLVTQALADSGRASGSYAFNRYVGRHEALVAHHARLKDVAAETAMALEEQKQIAAELLSDGALAARDAAELDAKKLLAERDEAREQVRVLKEKLAEPLLWSHEIRVFEPAKPTQNTLVSDSVKATASATANPGTETAP